MLTGSQNYRKKLILNIVRHLGPISRTELTDLTDYRPASVSTMIKELLEEELIVETGHTSVGHGRKRTMLEINKAHLCALGIAFRPGYATLLAVRIDGVVLREQTISAYAGMPRKELIELVAGQVQALLAQFQEKELLGIGIAEPLYDPASYTPEHSLLSNYLHYNDWVRQDLKACLEEQTGLPVHTYSGVTLPVVAERQFGVAKDADDFINIELSNGIGATLCCNGRPVAGVNGRAGEIGHTVISYGDPNPTLCFCGKPGCVEAQTAWPALAEQLKKALQQGVFSSLLSREVITVEAVRQALEEGDRLCLHCVKTVAEKIGVAVANAVNLLNPELVVLSGFMTGLGEAFLQPLEQTIRENALAISGDFQLRISETQETSLPLGAAAEVFSSYLRAEDYQWVYQLKYAARLHTGKGKKN